jgi:tellurite resistance protein TehA-like permease
MRRVRQAVESLTPGYFALVMATGIVSVGVKLKGFDILSGLLLIACAGSFVVLVGLSLWRLSAYPSAVNDDFRDPRRGFAFFTFVAGSNVLGVRLGMDGHYAVTSALLAISGVVWLVLGYVVPWTAVLGREERPTIALANGMWFVWVVASQSVAVAAPTIEPPFETARREMALLAVTSWSVGVFLYAAVGMIVSLRLLLYEIAPEDLTPTYWISMGALAITVLAGARIVEMADAPMVHVTRHLIAGTSVAFWAFATWLIPVLVGAGWWRHGRERVPLRYEAALWGIIFPLGMYAVAGIYLGEADRLPIVGLIGSYELWVAFASWLLLFLVMVVHLWRTVFSPHDEPQRAPRRAPHPQPRPRQR